MVIENPKIFAKIKDFDGDDRIKEILKRSIEIEKEQEQISTSSEQLLGSYKRLLEQYIDDSDLIEYCEKNERK